MNFKYIFGVILSIPLLPLMYFQGKKIKASVPELPEAKGIKGSTTNANSKKTLNLLTIGESTIAGVGVKTHEEGFTGTLAKELSSRLSANVDWKVYARSGYTARRVHQKIIPKIQESHADIIVVGLGGNDAFTLNRPNTWRKDMSMLITALKLKFPFATIVFCNMPPIKEFPAFTPLIKFVIGNLVELLGKELNEIVQKYDNVYYIDEVITLQRWIKKMKIEAPKSAFFSDGVHPSKLAYQTWAKDMANTIYNDKLVQKN